MDPTNRRKRQRSSEESAATSSSKRSARSENTDITIPEEDDTQDKDTMASSSANILPLLEAPGDFEANFYYAAFPSRPRLVGRTSAGVTPWWRLELDDDDPLVADDRYWGRGSTVVNEMAYGPVGPHKLHDLWEAGTKQRVQVALRGLPWTCIDVLRIGRSHLAMFERPIVVWVGVRPLPLPEGSVDGVRPKHDWAMVAEKLRAVRRVLDADGLTDVECEFRETEVIQLASNTDNSDDSNGDTAQDMSDEQAVAGQAAEQAADQEGQGDDQGQEAEPAAAATNIPRLNSPVRGHNRFRAGRVLEYALQITTAIGQSISSSHKFKKAGTLGLYLVPRDEDFLGEDGEKPVWALTCHHVAYPFDKGKAGKSGNEGETGATDDEDDNTSTTGETRHTPSSSPTPIKPSILLPAPDDLKHHESLLRDTIDEVADTLGGWPDLPGAEGDEGPRIRELFSRLLSGFRSHIECGRDNTSIGTVALSPPITSADMYQHLPEMDGSQSPFTLDWALVSLNRQRFPPAFDFTNVVDYGDKMQRVYKYIEGYIQGNRGQARRDSSERSIQLRRQPDALMPLNNGLVPLDELRGRVSHPPPHKYVTDRDPDNDRPVLIVLKRGRTTGLTAGVLLDVTSARRDPDGSNDDMRSELAIVELKRQKVGPLDTRRPLENVEDRFSDAGDSGAAVFDLDGRICALLTGGTTHNKSIKTVDISYATPMTVLLPIVEHELGIPLRIL